MARHTAAVCVTGAAAAAFALSACSHVEPYQKPLTPVRTAAVETYSDASTVKYSGSVEPHSRVDLAFRVGGYVEELATVPDAAGGSRPIQEGDPIAAGTVLARLRQGDYTDKVNQARAALDQARAGVEQAQSSLKGAAAAREKARLDFERAAHLFDKQSLTKTEMDAARAGNDGAQAAVDSLQAQVTQGQARIAQAQAQLAEAELGLRDTALVAPKDGVLLKRTVEIGSLTGPGAPAFSIIDVRTVKVVFGAPDVVLNRVRMGQMLPVTSEAVAGAGFSGRVTRISPTADPRSRVFEVEVTVPNPDGRLRPGMIATLELQQGAPARKLPVVPLPAVQGDGRSYWVFVLEHRDGRDYVRTRPIRLGDPIGNRIAVIDGVGAGESVVVSGATLIREGEAVQVLP